MSVDDLLFAPIDPGQSASVPDFFIRHNVNLKSYDWKPMSARAHEWSRAYLTRSYLNGQQHYDGWILHVAHERGPPHDNPAPWVKQLITDNYVFEEITLSV